MYRRREFLRAVGAVGAGVGVAGCAAPGAPTRTPAEYESLTPVATPDRLYNPSFERGFEGWVVGRDLPEDPETGRPVASGARVVPDGVDDERSVELSIDGRQDDGTVWLQQPANLRGAESFSFAVYSPEQSDNTITNVAAFAGRRPSRGYLLEEDFDTSMPVEDHTGWKRYSIPVDHDGRGMVAAGVSVVWETEVARRVDALRVTRSEEG